MYINEVEQYNPKNQKPKNILDKLQDLGDGSVFNHPGHHKFVFQPVVAPEEEKAARRKKKKWWQSQVVASGGVGGGQYPPDRSNDSKDPDPLQKPPVGADALKDSPRNTNPVLQPPLADNRWDAHPRGDDLVKKPPVGAAKRDTQPIERYPRRNLPVGQENGPVVLGAEEYKMQQQPRNMIGQSELKFEGDLAFKKPRDKEQILSPLRSRKIDMELEQRLNQDGGAMDVKPPEPRQPKVRQKNRGLIPPRAREVVVRLQGEEDGEVLPPKPSPPKVNRSAVRKPRLVLVQDPDNPKMDTRGRWPVVQPNLKPPQAQSKGKFWASPLEPQGLLNDIRQSQNKPLEVNETVILNQLPVQDGGHAVVPPVGDTHAQNPLLMEQAQRADPRLRYNQIQKRQVQMQELNVGPRGYRGGAADRMAQPDRNRQFQGQPDRNREPEQEVRRIRRKRLVKF